MGLDDVGAELTAKTRDIGDAARRQWRRTSDGAKLLLMTSAAVHVGFRVPRLRPFMYRHFAMSWRNTVQGRRWHTLGTSVFAHDSFLHFGFNCYAMTAMFPYLQSSMDRRNKYLSTSMQAAAFIAVAGVAANLFGLMMAMAIPPLLVVSSVGMSGGLYAAFAVVTQSHPHIQWQLLFIPQPISSETMLTCMVGLDAAGLAYLATGGMSLIAHHVHLMGAMTGLLAHNYILPKRHPPTRLPFNLNRFWS